MGLLNNSKFFQSPIGFAIYQGLHLARGNVQKSTCLTRPARTRQDVPFLGRGLRVLGERSVQMST